MKLRVRGVLRVGEHDAVPAAGGFDDVPPARRAGLDLAFQPFARSPGRPAASRARRGRPHAPTKESWLRARSRRRYRRRYRPPRRRRGRARRRCADRRLSSACPSRAGGPLSDGRSRPASPAFSPISMASSTDGHDFLALAANVAGVDAAVAARPPSPFRSARASARSSKAGR